MHVTGTLLLLCLTISSLGQTLSRQDLAQDLTFLNEAVRRGHPVNYEHQDAAPLAQLIDSVNALGETNLSVSAYRLVIGSALQRIGCVHTSVVRNPLSERHPPRYFPFVTYLLHQKLYVGRQSADTQAYEGQEIVAINGVPVRKIVGELLQYAASDGGGQAFAQQYINRASTGLLAFYFNYPDQYQLQFPDQDVVIAAIQTPVTGYRPSNQETSLLRNQENRFAQLAPGVALLTVKAFSRSDVAFIKQAFEAIKKAGLTHLILDLRGNTGGNRSASVTLAKQLVDQPFSYSILQPKLRPGPFLNPTGRFYLLLSRFKYQIGHFFKRHRTGFGTEFRYRYQPVKERYRGQLYVLTDGFTASAATMVTTWVKQHTSAVFVGSQAAGGYNGNNGGSFPLITLPHSKMQIRFPVYRLILDDKSSQRTGLVPDYMPAYTIEDVLLNRDKEIEFVLARIADSSN